MNKKIIFVALLLAALMERIAFDMGSNYELITATMIIASLYLGRKEAVGLVFLTLLFSDLVIGNTNIFIFTWTGFLLPALFAKRLLNDKNILKKLSSGIITGAASVGFFFIWTNFGVWITTSMYSKDLIGLLHSYINALPFLRNQALSAMIFIPSGILLTELYFKLSNRVQEQKISQKIFT